MDSLNEIVTRIDDFVWGPVMLILLVGTGIFLTVRTRFLTWRNLGYALKSTLSKEARTKSRGQGDVSPFSALTTALAATIGTGNIVGVATAMVSGGPGALVWMWISAAFGLTSKFSECMLAIKYREVNAKGEMSGGPMYTMKKGLKNKTFGTILAWLFALFAVIASFGIGNMTQGNSIASALHSTFNVPTQISGVVITVLSLVIIVGGIKSISKVSCCCSYHGNLLRYLRSDRNHWKYFQSAFRSGHDLQNGFLRKSSGRRTLRFHRCFHDECHEIRCCTWCLLQ